MSSNQTEWAQVDEEGRLVLPAEVMERYGLGPGARLRLEMGPNDIHLHRPVTHLAKVYIEPTNHCNLNCRTCIRHSWDEPLGRMTSENF